MLLPLSGLDEAGLHALVKEQFGAPDGVLEFAPLGGDSWHYRVGGLWISVRRDLRGHVPEAYEGARLLRDSGLEFVVAPLRGADGGVSRRFRGSPVVVFRYRRVDSPASPTPPELAAVRRMLAVVHAATVPLPLPRETFELPFGQDVVRALDVAAAGAPDSGPYSRPAERLIRAHRGRITRLLAEFEEAARACAKAGDRFVLTHGEPGAGNVLREGDRMLLGDWGELMWGPPERDLYHLSRSFGVPVPGRGDFLRLYGIRWYFNEFTEYAGRFFGPHAGDAEDASMWRNLVKCLEEEAR